MQPLIGKVLSRLEKGMVYTLLVLLALVLAFATIQLVVTVITDTASRWSTVRSIDELGELRPVFSGFLLILIGLELMKTISTYLSDHVVQVEVVLTVAMIAVARHAIEIDYANADFGQLAGTALLVFSLTFGYYLYHRTQPKDAARETTSVPPDRSVDRTART
jgi:uncharacterized membrane protein (DUF373 family)